MDPSLVISRNRFRPTWTASGSKAMMIVGVSLVLELSCLPAFAQLNYGRILGTVTDQSGGAIVGTTVTVTDTARGVSRALVTDNAGEYNAPSLLPSTYTVRAEANGFRALDRQNIVVGVGQDVRVDLTLQPGEQTQTITVTEAAPIVNTTNAELGGTLSTQSFGELPIIGRVYHKLLEFVPGIVEKPGTNFVATNGITGGTNWMLDGVSAINIFDSAGPLVGFAYGLDALSLLPLDAIQEMNVIENPKAEFGWFPTSQVNVGLKSGTNSLHGTADALGRDTALNARNPFLSARGTDQLEQFSASIGGPIKKDKLFYFGAYEGERFTIGNPTVNQIPTTASLGGDTTNSIPDAIADINKNGAALSPLSLALAGCPSAAALAGVINPAAINCSASSGLFGNSQTAGQGGVNVTQAFLASGLSDNGIVKLDYHLSDHNTVNGEYFFTKASSDAPNGTIGQALAGSNIQSYWDTFNKARVDLLRAVWVWSPNSNWLNEARFGWDRTHNLNAQAECEQPNGSSSTAPMPDYKASFGFVSGAPGHLPDDCGFSIVNIDKLTSLGTANGSVEPSGSLDLVNSTSYTHGKHALKFGGEFHRDSFSGSNSFPSLSHVDGITGVVNFGGGGAVAPAQLPNATGLEDFLTGFQNGGQLLVGSTLVTFYQHRFALFAEDDYRVRRNVTVNFGLRWEGVPGVADTQNKFGNFDPNSPTGMVQQQNGKPLYDGRYKNFEPRFGVAWDVTGKGTTVIRASANILYMTIFSLNGLNAYPFGAQLNKVPTGFGLYDASGNLLKSPGNSQTGLVNLLPGQMTWAQNTPVFNDSPSALVCGNGLVTATVLGVVEKPSPCFLSAMDPHYRGAGAVASWTLSFQHAITNNMAVTIAYVGNHGWGQSYLGDTNQPAPGPSGTQAEQLRRFYYAKFPYLGQIYFYTNGVSSNYDALQASLTQRVSHGLTFTVKYDYAHELQMDGGNYGMPMDSRNPQLDYGSGSIPFEDFGVTATYAIPGRKSPGQLLEGWELNTTIAALGVTPLDAVDKSQDLSGTGEGRDRWTLAGKAGDFAPLGALTGVPCFGAAKSRFVTRGCTLGLPQACIDAANGETVNAAMNAANPGSSSGLASLNKLGCYMEGSSVIVPPAQGTFGTMSRNALTKRPFREWDMSITKKWTFKERYSAQFRAEFFNLINVREYGNPRSDPSNPATFGIAAATPNVQSPINGAGGPREIQLGLKLGF
jgi:hypothetical protein